ncbi:MAG: ComF family protein [Faecalibacterium sp.]
MLPYYSILRRAARGMRQLLYPRRCPFCNRVLGGRMECPDCRAEREELLRFPNLRIDRQQHYLGELYSAAAPFLYRGCVRQGILRTKYGGAPWTGIELGIWMTRLLTGCAVQMYGAEPIPEPMPAFRLEYDCIVPVPSGGKARGYNVPALLAVPLAQAMDLPLEEHALRRVRTGRHQVGLPLEERLQNVAGAFCVQDRDAIRDRRVLLVDDVITTGATASSCAQALLEAGARRVSIFALATVEFPPGFSRTEPIFEDEDTPGTKNRTATGKKTGKISVSP